MQRLLALLLFAVVVASCGPQSSARENALISSAEFGRDSAGGVIATIVNQRWYAERMDLEATTWLRIAETDSATFCGGELEWCHKLHLIGWWGSPDSTRTPTWTRTIVGKPDGFDRPHRPEFFRVLHPGCCDTQDAVSYVSVRTGAVTFRATGALLRLSGDRETTVRRIAYLDTWSALSPVEADTDSTISGVIQYGAPDGPVHRVALMRDPSAPAWKHCCRLDSLGIRTSPGGRAETEVYLSHPAEQLARGLSVWIRLLPDYELELVDVIVPIRGDSLDLSGAQVPLGLRLVRLPGAT